MENDEFENFEAVYEEVGENYQILWFVWKKDGTFPWPDWEPLVIVFGDDGELKTCAVRRAFRWEIYKRDELVIEGNALEIVFQGRNHHPIVKAEGNKEQFDFIKSMMSRIPLTQVRKSSREIPSFARDSKHLLTAYPSLMHILVLLYPYLVDTPSVDEKINELLSRDG